MTDPTEGAPNQGQRPRRKQVLLQPLLQTKLGLYSMLLSLAFSAAVLGVLHAQWTRFRSWLEMTTKVDALIDTELATQSGGTLVWLAVLILIFFVGNVMISVLATHRLVGPTIAFRRHIKALTEGDYSAQTTLRNNDAFREVAEDLNKLSAKLQERHGGAPPPSDA